MTTGRSNAPRTPHDILRKIRGRLARTVIMLIVAAAPWYSLYCLYEKVSVPPQPAAVEQRAASKAAPATEGGKARPGAAGRFRRAADGVYGGRDHEEHREG